MSAPPTISGSAGRISRLFGLEGDRWMRHANPVSVWSRFSVLALLALAIWSRDWIGWLCLVPVALAIAWMMVNPLVFAPPRSTRNWASKGRPRGADLDGTGLWPAPAPVTATVPTLANLYALAGIALLAYGLAVLHVLPVVAVLVIASAASCGSSTAWCSCSRT